MKKYNLLLLILTMSFTSYTQDGFDYLARSSYVQDEDVARIEIKLLPGTTVSWFTTAGHDSYHAYIDPYLPINGYASGKHNMNYVRAYSPIKDNATNNEPVHNSFDYFNHWKEKITYYDGLGREIQFVNCKASPDGRDIIQPIIYDDLGRISKEYMPYSVKQDGGDGPGGYRPKVVDEQLLVTQALYGIDHIITYTEKIFECSPLNRLLKQGAPGIEWNIDEDATIDLTYGTNNTSEVKMYNITHEGKLEVSSSGYYSKGELIKVITNDEDNNVSVKYKDKSGNLILEIVAGNYTYYVYDDFNQLRYVISPEASNIFLSNTGVIGDYLSNETINTLCYYYEYDDRKRMILKQIPGKKPEYLVYDDRDRLVLTQDGNLRSSNFWLFTKYDELNRPIMTGKYMDQIHTGQLDMSTYVNDYYSLPGKQYYESLELSDDNGYTNNSFPDVTTTGCNIYSLTYYDNYLYIGQTLFSDFHFETNSYNLDYNDLYTKGKITAIKTKILPTSGIEPEKYENWIIKALYYDEFDNVIQTVSNLAVGGINRVSNKYNYTGELLEMTQYHKLDTELLPNIIVQTFNYDHAGRLLSETHKVNNKNAVQLSEYEYDELGKLIEKKLHKNTQNQSWTQKLNFKYNIRDWLTEINDVDNIDYDHFALRLSYTTGEYPQYNGNISKLECNYGDISGIYDFNYDSSNRLTTADYSGFGNYSTDYSYTPNGNLLSLSRMGMLDSKSQFGLIDVLNYNSYNGNQLLIVNDGVAPQNQAFGFTDNGSYGPTNEYSYDNNGNMITDLNMNILDMRYNHLNLPTEINLIQQGVLNKILYLYDAVGTKICKQPEANNGAIVRSTNYLGNFVYTDNQLSYILTSEGRIIPKETGEYDYQYFIKDHLGNTRILFNEDKILHSACYYPYGMLMKGFGDYESVTTNNNYLYNGKEIQDDFELDWYDYGARMYDSKLGRWFVVDNQSEKYRSYSTYEYALNNPVNAIDPDGELVIFVNGFRKKQYISELCFTPAKWLRKNNRISMSDNRHYINGYEQYWGSFATLYKERVYDKNDIHVDGMGNGPNSLAEDRYRAGIRTARKIHRRIKRGKINYSENETMKIVGHSHGVAHAAGMADFFAKKGYTVERFDAFAAHQPNFIKLKYANKMISVNQWSRKSDEVSSTKLNILFGNSKLTKIDGVPESNYFVLKDVNHSFGGHFIETFTSEVFESLNDRYDYILPFRLPTISTHVHGGRSPD